MDVTRELREIIDLVPHHISVVAPGRTRLYANRALLDYYALTNEGLQDSEADTEMIVRRFAHPDDVATLLPALARGFSGTAPWETEGRFRRRDGEYRWFLIRFTPLHDDGGR